MFRGPEGNLVEEKFPEFKSEAVSNFINLYPWDNFFEPDGFKTMAKFIIAQEPSLEDTNEYFFQFHGKGSPNLWMTACAHPGAKSHDLYAKKLYEHITNNIK